VTPSTMPFKKFLLCRIKIEVVMIEDALIKERPNFDFVLIEDIRCEGFCVLREACVNMNGRLFELLNGKRRIVPHLRVNRTPSLSHTSIEVLFLPINVSIEETIV
jgi:hypothetical protein